MCLWYGGIWIKDLLHGKSFFRCWKLIIKYNTYNRQAGLVRTDYTSIENIHKVIDPLFLDDLKAEFEEIKQISVIRTRDRKLRALQDKLTSLIFLDIKTPRLIQLNYSSADFAAWGVSWRLRGKLWKSGCPGCFYGRKCRWSKSQTKNMRSGRNTKQRKRRATSFCRIQSGSSARPTALTHKRSVSTSLRFCRRSVRLKRDNESASEPMWFRGVSLFRWYILFIYLEECS